MRKGRGVFELIAPGAGLLVLALMPSGAHALPFTGHLFRSFVGQQHSSNVGMAARDKGVSALLPGLVGKDSGFDKKSLGSGGGFNPSKSPGVWKPGGIRATPPGLWKQGARDSYPAGNLYPGQWGIAFRSPAAKGSNPKPRVTNPGELGGLEVVPGEPGISGGSIPPDAAGGDKGGRTWPIFIPGQNGGVVLPSPGKGGIIIDEGGSVGPSISTFPTAGCTTIIPPVFFYDGWWLSPYWSCPGWWYPRERAWRYVPFDLFSFPYGAFVHVTYPYYTRCNIFSLGLGGYGEDPARAAKQEEQDAECESGAAYDDRSGSDWETLWESSEPSRDPLDYPYLAHLDGELGGALLDVETSFRSGLASLLMRHIEEGANVVIRENGKASQLKSSRVLSWFERTFGFSGARGFSFLHCERHRRLPIVKATGRTDGREIYVVLEAEVSADGARWHIQEIGLKEEGR